MKITKLGHSCLLVEMPAPVNRTVLFDPGVYSEVNVDSLVFLDDIVITHEHSDHCNVELLQQLVRKFPNVRIKTPSTLVPKLENISVTTDAVEGIEIFQSPHEGHPPFMDPPEQIGVHYLGKLTHPGDSHSFTVTKDILALPIIAPWGSTDRAVQLALQLAPKIIIPIHDWQWKDVVRDKFYKHLGEIFEQAGINFIKPENGKAFVLDV
jgi:L-ascorbate metabolism protein UlaG (beta-lactamase superfamily)